MLFRSPKDLQNPHSNVVQTIKNVISTMGEIPFVVADAFPFWEDDGKFHKKAEQVKQWDTNEEKGKDMIARVAGRWVKRLVRFLLR